MATVKEKLAEFRKNTSVKKDGYNPFFKSSYYTLEDLLNAVKDADKYGISYAQYIDHPYLVTELEHEADKITSKIMLPEINEKNHQAVAAQITYFRRISLITMFGICEPDDDGNVQVNDDLESELKKCKTVQEINALYTRKFKKNNLKPSDVQMEMFKSAKEKISNAV